MLRILTGRLRCLAPHTGTESWRIEGLGEADATTSGSWPIVVPFRGNVGTV